MVKVTIQHDDKTIKEMTGDYAWGAVVKENDADVSSNIFLTGTVSPMDLGQNMESTIEALLEEAADDKQLETAALLLMLSNKLKEKAGELLSNESQEGIQNDNEN